MDGQAREQAAAELLDLPGALRALRRRADLSQRELAARSGVPAATVGHIESGTSANPRLRTVERLVRAAGARLAIVDLDGTEPAPLATDTWRDAADRRYPPHLDAGPETRWRRGARQDVISFFRDRQVRDLVRREAAGERRADLFTEIRRLGPGDADVLAILQADGAELDLSGAPATPAAPLSDEQALRYLRDPSLRHWVAECHRSVRGHLVAYVQLRHAGPPAMVVTELGILPEERAGLVGPLLVAALCDEAARLGVGEIVALAADRAVARCLRGLGFVERPVRRLPVLQVPE